MDFPLSISDISLWLAITAIILLITSELLSSPTEYSRRIIIEKKRLRITALIFGVAFMITVIIHAYQ